MVTPRFSLSSLFAAVDVERRHRGLAWKALSGEVGVAVSTIRRFETADDAEADGVLALVRWLGVTPESFTLGLEGGGELLPPAGAGIVRVDMRRLSEAGMRPRLRHGQQRTTIQKLVEVATCNGNVGCLAHEAERDLSAWSGAVLPVPRRWLRPTAGETAPVNRRAP